jgi:hypothetical protein
VDEPDVPHVHSGAAMCGDRLHDNHHLHDLAESTNGNMGDPSDDGNESGSTDGATRPKSSDASDGSQRGHSTRSVGKPRAWGRATAYQVPQSTTTPLYTKESWLETERKRG